MTGLIITAAVFIFGFTIGGTILVIAYAQRSQRRREVAQEGKARETLPFRWRYIALPLIMLLVSAVLAAIFYGRLPADVAYHFRFDGSPDQWAGRSILLVSMLAPHLLLVLGAGMITVAMTKLGILSMAGQSIQPEKVLMVMGNTLGLPQLVLSFVMLDIFLYNSYQIHIMPALLFLAMILGLATVALVVALSYFVLKARRLASQSRQNIKRNE